MGGITVYHGGTEVVATPICTFGRDCLDFGRGFYLTTIKSQAEKWACYVADQRRKNTALLNIYTLDRDALMREAQCRIFDAYDRAWLRFIVANRRGENAAAPYDYIEGGVADDRVINTINMHVQGYYSEEYALRLLSLHRPNNQICIRKQELIDRYLRYERTEPA